MFCIRVFVIAVVAMTVAETMGHARAKSPDLPDKQMVVSSVGNADSLISFLDRGALDVIEGVWKFGGEGSVIAIISRPTDVPVQADYVIVSVAGADRALRPGTVIGTVNRGGERGSYSASFYRRYSPESGGLSGKCEFTLDLASDMAFLRFIPRHGRLRLYLPALLPGIAGRLFRQGYIDRSCDGCHRLYPEPITPVEPRYL